MGPGVVGVSERAGGERLARPRAFSQSAMHSLERSERSNPQVLAELAQVNHTLMYTKVCSNIFGYMNKILNIMSVIHGMFSPLISLSLSLSCSLACSLSRYVVMGASFQAVVEQCLTSRGV